jgi:hypothetical protein
MFMTIFWATGAVILSAIAWQFIFVGAAYVIVGVAHLLWFLIRLPYFLVIGIWYLPRAVVCFFTSGWVREFHMAAGVLVIISLLLAPIFWGSL